MRKIAIITIAMMLAISMSAVSFAGDIPAIKYGTKLPSETAAVAKGDTKIKISGSLRFRHRYDHNVQYQLKDSKLAEAGIAPASCEGLDCPTDNHRSWLDTRVRLKVEAQVSSYVKGVIELQSGNQRSDIWIWGNNGDIGGALGVYNRGNYSNGDLWVRQAWIGYDRHGIGLKVGHQPVTLGNGLYMEHEKFGDDAVYVYAQPTKYSLVGFLYAKFNESDTRRNDDANFYVGMASYKGSNYSVSGDISYLDDQAPSNTDFRNNHIWNFGLQGHINLSPITIRGDVEVQTGEFDYVVYSGDNDDLDVETVAGLFGIDWRVGPSMITVEGAYGSGDDDPNDDDYENFITSLSANRHYTFVYEYRMKTACGMTNSGLCNTGYVKIGTKTQLIPKVLTGELDIFWLQAVEEVALNNYHDPSHELGWELDGRITYNFAKNLKYFIEGGFMFLGDAYEHPQAGKDDPYYVANGLMLKF